MEAAVDRRPLRFALATENAAWEKRIDVLVWAFVALGAALRIGRYALRFPLWGDEMMLASSFLDRDYGDFLRPLDCGMCSPVLFLWMVKTSVLCGGFSEYTLRLVPLATSLVGLLLFRHVARRLMTGVPQLAAVAIFAVSYYPIRHASELRSYAGDLTVALALFALAVEWWREPSRSRWMWALAAFAPFAVGLSYPAAFVGGGISIGLAWHVWKQGDRGSKIAFAAYNLALVGGFLFFVKLTFATQYDASSHFTVIHWAPAFPPLHDPLRLVVWTAESFTGELFAYPLGGDNGGSLLTSIGCIVGGVVLWRNGRAALAGVFAGLLALALFAAALHKYPFGGEHPTQYLVPFVCLFAGLGGGYLVCKLRQAAGQRRLLVGGAATLAAIGCGLALHFAVRPYKHVPDEIHRGFARWFWREMAADAELVCLNADEGRDFGVEKPYEYLAMQRIYSPRHHRGEPPSADKSGRLRCVTYHKSSQALDEKVLGGWLAEMRSQYDFVGRTNYRVQMNLPHMTEDIGVYEVFEFAPRGGAAIETARRPQ